MSPSAYGPNEILTNDNYFLWEFTARMALARKELLEHVLAKPEPASLQSSDWRAADLKALAIIVKLISPTFQSMVREAQTAFDAWAILRDFFAKQNLHNRVQLRKQLAEFELSEGGDLMHHLLQFDELCLKLAAVGERVGDDEKLVVLLGSLPQEYDAMVRVIEAANVVSLLEAKEMLRREYETLQKREKKEMAFKASVRQRRGVSKSEGHHVTRGNERKNGSMFKGRCYACNQVGHRKKECPRNKQKNGDEFVFSVTTGSSVGDSVWLLDSGASCHMTGDFADFIEYRDLKQSIWVTVANGQRLEAKGRGSVRFLMDGERTVKLTDVLFLPELGSKLVSVPGLTAHGVIVQFEESRAILLSGGSVVATVPKVGKLFAWRVGRRHGEEANVVVGFASVDANMALWHARLGHVSHAKMKMIAKACGGVPNFSESEANGAVTCTGCALGKMTTSPFSHTSGSEVKTQTPFELVHSDVMGPIKPTSKGGAKYIVTFIDDYSRMVFVYPIKAKSEVFERFKDFKAMVETQYGVRIRCLRSDNGGEYTSKRFNRFCASAGILHQTSAPYSPQQNGLAKRLNRTLGEGARASMHFMDVDRVWWAEAILTFAHVLNRIPNTAHPDKSPVEIVTEERPVLDYLHVFGAEGFYRVDDSKRSKLDARAHRCIFRGYSASSKAYRVWDLEDERIVVTRSVVLNELPPASHRTVVYVDGSDSQRSLPTNWDDDGVVTGSGSPSPVPNQEPEAMQIDEDGRDRDVEMATADASSIGPLVPLAGGNGTVTSVPGPDGAIDPSVPASGIFEQLLPDRLPVIGNGRRFPAIEHHAPLPMPDRLVFSGGSARSRHIAYAQLPLLTGREMAERHDQDLPRLTDAAFESSGDAEDDIERENKRPRLDSYEIALVATDVPQTYADAMASPGAEQWKEAVRTEIHAHVRNHTWDR